MDSEKSFFSGVHGTSVKNAEAINQEGFQFSSFDAGQSNYGAGVYFYESDASGRQAALAWAAFRYKDEPAGVCEIIVNIPYDPKLCIWWDKGFEDLTESLLRQEYPQRDFDTLPEELKAAVREHLIDYEAQRKGIDTQVVFVDFPLHGVAAKHQSGCCVKNLAIMPSPPYEIFLP